MAALTDTLRGNFEKAVIKARDAAEKAAHAALTTLAVENDRPFESMKEGQRLLRRALRARARQLGEGDMTGGMPQLIEEIAYEQWHRMLFARFLAENDLLMHPEGVAVTLEECAELAQEEGAEDLWAVATRFAGLMLPGIFRVNDPALQVRFAPEGRHRLEQIVTDLPQAVFTSDDGLGWAYQFWQSKKKDEVNASERKIGGADISPVTQLFTEDYMVKFLLHNTLGAWWAHRHPDSPLNKTFEYLRYREDGTPAAGTFAGWPDRVAEVTMMDPCGGSGHFVVAAFEMFTSMRMEEEGLTADEATDEVLRENVHMLELDLRCTQIAAFSLTVTAWKYSGYHALPTLNIVCCGIPVQGELANWTKLASSNEALKWSLERLYDLFRNAPDLGSLIDPTFIPLEERMFVSDYSQIEPWIHQALVEDQQTIGPFVESLQLSVQSMVRSTKLLSTKYTLVITNVPFLQRNKQETILQEFCSKYYPNEAEDLATVFISRIRGFLRQNGTMGLVTPQNWLFLGTYEDMRLDLLDSMSWKHVSYLGAGAFETISGEVVKPVLIVLNDTDPKSDLVVTGLDVSDVSTTQGKINVLRKGDLREVLQISQLKNPDARIMLDEPSSFPLLQDYAESLAGIQSGDYPRFGRFFWEMNLPQPGWEFQQSTVSNTTFYGGREHILFWEDGEGALANSEKSYIRGRAAFGRLGVAVKQVGELPCTIYTGELFDNNTAVILPNNPELLASIWAFCSSDEFNLAVRKLDRKLNVTNATLAKVPFDLERWQSEAEVHRLLPEPQSDDPTQWLFHGLPEKSRSPLQMAVVRLLGYVWPRQNFDMISNQADDDGLVCLPSIVREQPAAERLRALLARAFGDDWSLTVQRRLLAGVNFKGKNLDQWLRDGFFRQHSKLFKNRPFIWHIWDGRKDGFSVLVNYHNLDNARLQRLIYTYLGDWINTQRAEQEQGIAGADGRLVSALELKKKLELILEGEPPYDIYVRWKPLHEQPIGWNPDLNDGVRLNIRPFVTAGVLRSKFTVHWRKDRGKDSDGSERHNDLHFTRAEKEAAQEAALKTR